MIDDAWLDAHIESAVKAGLKKNNIIEYIRQLSYYHERPVKQHGEIRIKIRKVKERLNHGMRQKEKR